MNLSHHWNDHTYRQFDNHPNYAEIAANVARSRQPFICLTLWNIETTIPVRTKLDLPKIPDVVV